MRIVHAAYVALSAFALCTVMSAARPALAAPGTAAPDFSGFYVRVGDLWFDPILDDNEGKPIERLEVKGPDAEDIWAGDSDNPILQPWAREIVKKNADSELRLEHVYTADDSCWPSGVPQAVNLLDEVQFLQTKDRVTILYRRDHQVRHVYLNVPHSQNPKPSWYGESVGHYEDGALVVDTIGFNLNDKTFVDRWGTPHSEQLHLIERYKPSADGRTMTLEVTYDDPKAYTMKWGSLIRYRKGGGMPVEVACAESTVDPATGLANPIPVAAKPDF